MNNAMTDELQVPVLIVGGALVGLSLSLFLAWQGLPSFLVEKHAAPARLPRARGHNARTMELFRLPGLEETIRAVPSPMAANRDMLRVESLAGRELARLEEGSMEDLSAFSPTTGCVLGQEHLELILLEHARKLGGELHFNTELLSFEQDATGVRALIRDGETRRTRQVRAQYLVAADGSHSTVRDALGIRTQRLGTVSHALDLLFEADLHEALAGRQVFLYYVSNPRLPDGQGGLMPLDNHLRWSFGTVFHPERGERREDFTDERCIDLIRIATGVPDLQVRLLSAYPWDSMKVGVWKLQAQHAEHYQQGRVFLMGDAAHAALPAGGLGAGTGIQDAFNLAWKLPLVLAGQADPGLLNSYEAERLPIGKLTAEQTLLRTSYRLGTTGRTFLSDADMHFGYRYRSSAVLSAPDAQHAPLTQSPSTLCGEPGTRAPHLLLQRAGSSVSTIDLCGGKWTLLAGACATAWSAAARGITQEVGLPLSVQQIAAANGWQDCEDRFAACYGIGPQGAVLVRPDGFVAWRSPDCADSAARQLRHVFSSLLGK